MYYVILSINVCSVLNVTQEILVGIRLVVVAGYAYLSFPEPTGPQAVRMSVLRHV